MRRSIKFVVLGALVALNMGASCRQETAQSVLNTFLTAIAETTGEAIGQTFADRPTP